jgi:predicted nucleotidyltransferase
MTVFSFDRLGYENVIVINECMIVDPGINSYLTDVTGCLRRRLGARFVGSYLHGSITMNAFQPTKSDIDVVVTVQRTLAPAAVDELHNLLASLPLPGAAVGLDLNVLSLGSAGHLTERSCWEVTIRVARDESGQAVRIGDRCDPMLFVDVALLR